VVDVARLAGVSLGTVSNVLNRPERVAPATRERVLEAIRKLGFVRNEAARQLRAGHSRMIGLIVLDAGNPFFADLAAGVEAAAQQHGLSVIVCNSANSAEREDRHLSLLQELRGYGVLITPVTGGSARRIEQLRSTGMPVVLVDRAAGDRQCSASVDDLAGGELAVAHLAAKGHKRIGIVGGPIAIKQVSDRLAGAKAALRAAGLPARALRVLPTADLNVASGREAGEQLAAMPEGVRPTAVFCVNDLLALGVLQVMTRRGLRVPDDMAIAGYDDIVFAAAAAVPLTSVRQPAARLGHAAAELLIEEVSGYAAHRHRQVVFEPELVIRASSEVQAGGHSATGAPLSVRTGAVPMASSG
jgi:LacI family transcriptional regulator